MKIKRRTKFQILILFIILLTVSSYTLYQRYIANTQWNIVSDGSTIPEVNIKFSFMYPSNLEVLNLPGATSKQVTNNKEWDPGYINMGGNIVNLEGKTNEKVIILDKKDAILGEKQAVRIFQIVNHMHGVKPNTMREIKYQIINLNMPEIDKRWGFAFSCSFIPKEGENLERVCDQAASTLKFQN